jgi:hypothetical protein
MAVARPNKMRTVRIQTDPGVLDVSLKLVCFAAASATALLCAQAAFAADAAVDAVELDKVTVTATRSEKKLQDAR